MENAHNVPQDSIWIMVNVKILKLLDVFKSPKMETALIVLPLMSYLEEDVLKKLEDVKNILLQENAKHAKVDLLYLQEYVFQITLKIKNVIIHSSKINLVNVLLADVKSVMILVALSAYLVSGFCLKEPVYKDKFKDVKDIDVMEVAKFVLLHSINNQMDFV